MFEPKDRMSSRRQYGVTCNVLCHIDYTSFPLTYNVYKALFNLGLILNNIVPRSEEDIYDVALGYLQVNLIELIRLDLLRRTFREYSGPDLIIERPETLLYRARHVCVEFKFNKGHLDYDLVTGQALRYAQQYNAPVILYVYSLVYQTCETIAQLPILL